MACIFQAKIGGELAPFIGLRNDNTDINTKITTYNTGVTDADSGILGKERRRKKLWIIRDILDFYNKKRCEAEVVWSRRSKNKIQGSK